jgi:hypothetical protein
VQVLKRFVVGIICPDYIGREASGFGFKAFVPNVADMGKQLGVWVTSQF